MSDKVIGVDIGGTNLRGAVVDIEGNIHNRMKIFSEADHGIEVLIDNLARFIRDISQGEKIKDIGIGIPGIIDSKDGVITQAPNISNVDNYPLRSALNKKLGEDMNVVIENDANCAALGEWWMGAAKEVASRIIRPLGPGDPGAPVLDGKLWTGADGMAGELGHITIYPDGAKCNCGNYGCLESYASANAIRRMVHEGLDDENLKTVLRDNIRNAHLKDVPKIVMESAASGDNFSHDIWRRVGIALGIGIAGLVNLLNVEMIVIGGGVSNGWDLFISQTLEESSKRAFREPIKTARIVRTRLIDDAGLLGASYSALVNRT
jgi:glucokinase